MNDQSPVGWSETTPWLFSTGTDYVNRADLGITVTFDSPSVGETDVSNLVFRAFRLDPLWRVAGLQDGWEDAAVCGHRESDLSAWQRFGTNYYNDCSMSVADALDAARGFGVSTSGETLFFDLYLQDLGGEVETANAWPERLYLGARQGVQCRRQPERSHGRRRVRPPLFHDRRDRGRQGGRRRRRRRDVRADDALRHSRSDQLTKIYPPSSPSPTGVPGSLVRVHLLGRRLLPRGVLRGRFQVLGVVVDHLHHHHRARGRRVALRSDAGVASTTDARSGCQVDAPRGGHGSQRHRLRPHHRHAVGVRVFLPLLQGADGGVHDGAPGRGEAGEGVQGDAGRGRFRSRRLASRISCTGSATTTSSSSTGSARTSSTPSGKVDAAPVSAWRKMFIANEWNELQSKSVASRGADPPAHGAVPRGTQLPKPRHHRTQHGHGGPAALSRCPPCSFASPSEPG